MQGRIQTKATGGRFDLFARCDGLPVAEQLGPPVKLQALTFREVAAIGGLQRRAGLLSRSPSRMPRVTLGITVRTSQRPDGAASPAGWAIPRSARCLPMPGGKAKLLKVQALVFVGDAMEEKIPTISFVMPPPWVRPGVPAFMFQEGTKPPGRSCISRHRPADAKAPIAGSTGSSPPTS